MPYKRPGEGVYVTATKEVLHGKPSTENGFVGVAVKQKAAGWNSVVADASKILVGEKFFLITKGIVQVDAVEGFAVGDPTYIKAADNTLNETNTNLKFGRVVEVAGQRGTPAKKVRINLDMKDGF